MPTLCPSADINALSNTSTFEDVQRVLDMMRAGAHALQVGGLPGLSEGVNAGRTQAMPIHMRQARALSILSFTPSTNASGVTDYTIEGGAPIFAFTHPPGVPPMTIVAASVVVPQAGAVVGSGLWLQLWLHGAPVTRPLEITATETPYEFDAFEVTMDEGSVFELRGNVNFTVSGYTMRPLHLHLWALMPIVRGPLQQA